MRSYPNIFFTVVCTSIFLVSCSKYLDKKSDQSLQVPSTIEDLQAILDNNNFINRGTNNGIGEASADNYYITTESWSSLSLQSDKSIYIWGEEIFLDDAPGFNDWSSLNSIVYKSNVVLEGAENISPDTKNIFALNNTKGSAYFLRGYAMFILANNFAPAYDAGTASTDRGIPVRLNSDFNIASVRSSVEETYAQIIEDLIAANALLPERPQHVMRPSRVAGYALLSRVYLAMRNYAQAALYADSSLMINDELMDYNNSGEVNAASDYPFQQFNKETLFYADGLKTPLYNIHAKVDTVLYQSYESGDLRKELFFTANADGSQAFTGAYTGNAGLFLGLSVDEVYITRAECRARLGDIDGALADLNALLSRRWDAVLFEPVVIADANVLLDKILLERRKELLMRDVRWMDIKRLNKEGYNIQLTRKVNGNEYNLAPNDNKFALPLPRAVLEISGMDQNPR